MTRQHGVLTSWRTVRQTNSPNLELRFLTSEMSVPYGIYKPEIGVVRGNGWRNSSCDSNHHFKVGVVGKPQPGYVFTWEGGGEDEGES